MRQRGACNATIRVHVGVPIPVGDLIHHVPQAAHEPDAVKAVTRSDVDHVVLAEAPHVARPDHLQGAGIGLPIELADEGADIVDGMALCITQSCQGNAWCVHTELLEVAVEAVVQVHACSVGHPQRILLG